MAKRMSQEEAEMWLMTIYAEREQRVTGQWTDGRKINVPKREMNDVPTCVHFRTAEQQERIKRREALNYADRREQLERENDPAPMPVNKYREYKPVYLPI